MKPAQHKLHTRTTATMGKGFFALEDIQPREILMLLDDSELIRYSSLTCFYEFHDLPTSKLLFAYFLAAASVIEGSADEEVQRIQRYVAELPQRLHGLLLWSQDQLGLIENRDLVDQVQAKRAQLQLQFNSTHGHVISKANQQRTNPYLYRLFHDKSQAELIRFEQVLYCYCMLESRSVYDSEYSQIGALAPGLQIFNHSNTKYCIVHIDQKIRVTAVEAIKKGEQIFVCYGDYSAEVFMEKYGFLPQLKQPIPCDEDYRRNLARQYNLICRQNNKNFG